MSEQYEEFEDEGQDDGVRNARAAKKAAEKRAREAEAKLAELEAQMELQQAHQRAESIKAALEASRLPVNLVSVYPADKEATPEAVFEWATQELGLAPAPEKQETQEAETAWDRYDRFVRGSFSHREGNLVEDLMDRALQGAMSALGPVERPNKFVPSDEEWKDAREITDRINSLNKEYEGQVMRGQAEPFSGGFGGKLDPPYHANRALQAMEQVRTR